MAAKVLTAPTSTLAAPVNAPAAHSAAADAAADALITTGAEVNSENNGNIPSADTSVDPALAAAASHQSFPADQRNRAGRRNRRSA